MEVHPFNQKCPQTGNRYVKRFSDFNPNPKKSPVDAWLAGRQQESKKVFSFKHPEEVRRTFGFVKPGLVDFEEMKRRLRSVWQNFRNDEFLEGWQVIEQLFQKEERS